MLLEPDALWFDAVRTALGVSAALFFRGTTTTATTTTALPLTRLPITGLSITGLLSTQGRGTGGQDGRVRRPQRRQLRGHGPGEGEGQQDALFSLLRRTARVRFRVSESS